MAKQADKTKKDKNFPIVGIGASAGGLEALEGLFSNMPSQTNIAFVVIQHLAPSHKSIMPSLLKKFTKMKTIEIEDGMEIEPDCIYLNPPDKDVAILNCAFQLIKPVETHQLRLPIDYFFRSLAKDRSEKAVCIILSGTGTDGTLGLKAVKGEGGMTMVQEERQARYDGMPRSAIETGLVDFILPIEKMPEELMKYVKHPYIKGTPKPVTAEEKFKNAVNKIFVLIRDNTGNDFSNYKLTTIRRRIERRMAVHQIDSIDHYVNYLQQRPAEIETLYKDMLITVTNFFRDKDAYKIIAEKVIPTILKNKLPESTIRIWVPGCATGEEAYSLAILFAEGMEIEKKHCNIQIFATDIDIEAIEYARLGVYPDSIAADVSPERLKRFFIKEENTYKVKKQIREMVVFAIQSLIKDPPFSKLDLVSCRNVLIYMNSVLQKKIIPLFHYTLNQNEFLFLGTSESVGEFTDLFSVVDSKWKVFQREGRVIEKGFAYQEIPFNIRSPELHKEEEKKMLSGANIRELVEGVLLDSYSPPCVLINEKYDIIYFHGDTERFLTTPKGEPSFNILKIAREEIRYKLNISIHRASKQQRAVVTEGLKIKFNGNFQSIDLIVRPVAGKFFARGLMLVIFDDRKASVETVPTGKKVIHHDDEEDSHVTALEQELQSTKEYLQTTVEELETSNEELKSTNEELQSTNEELQSTNEELETSKEELQSTNEELATVNSELQHKVEELSNANNDLNNLLSSTEIGTIFLDTNLRIKRFTPSAAKIFNLIQSDIGRPISDITSKIKYENLYEDAIHVLDTLTKLEVDVHTQNGDYYAMRVIPYRTVDNIIDGVVITFVNITKLKQSERTNKIILQTTLDGFLAINTNGSILDVNDAYCCMTGYNRDEILHMKTYDLKADGTPDDTAMQMKKIIERGSYRFETNHMRKDGSIINLEVSANYVDINGGRLFAFLRDITEKKLSEEKIRKINAELKQLVKERTEQIELINKRLQSVIDNSNVVIYIKDTEGKYITINKEYESLFNITKEKITGKTDHDIFPKDMADKFRENDRKVLEAERLIQFDEIAPHQDGPHSYVSIKFPLFDLEGAIYAVCGISTDITERKEIEEECKRNIQKLEKELERNSEKRR